jgi:hypothetical protein
MFNHPPQPVDDRTHAVYSNRLNSPQQLNETLLAEFLRWQDDDSVRKTHLFEGRYENIYLDETHIPELSGLIETAVKSAEAILQTQGLRAGYWFNYMPAGSTTTLHTHDDDDELLSGVYYVHVPENSGNLIIHEKTPGGLSEKIEIHPEAGKFVFFKPDAPHEVGKNLSAEHRLSIGMNFGKPLSE